MLLAEDCKVNVVIALRTVAGGMVTPKEKEVVEMRGCMQSGCVRHAFILAAAIARISSGTTAKLITCSCLVTHDAEDCFSITISCLASS